MHKWLCFVLFLEAAVWAAPSDAYGYPLEVRITDAKDREAFMRWFAAIAEAQYTAPSPDWNAEDQDCAGLLRFAYVEALKPKTAAWFAKFPYLPERNIPAVKSLSYPLPQIGRSVFRVAPGAYQRGGCRSRKTRRTHYRLVSYALQQRFFRAYSRQGQAGRSVIFYPSLG